MPRRPVAISVTNSGGRPIRLQAEVLLWQQTDGKDRYEPSDALLVVPSIVDVPANSTQVVRVVLRSPVPSPVERTYRLVLDDITEEKAEGGGRRRVNQLQVHAQFACDDRAIGQSA